MAQLFTKMPTGQTVVIDISANDVVDDIKNKIQDKTGIPLNEQILQCNGRVIRDSDINHETTFDVILPIRGGAMQMYVYFDNMYYIILYHKQLLK